MADEVNDLTRGQALLFHVQRVEEDDAALVMNPSVAVVEAVDCRVELVVAAHGHHHQLTGRETVSRKRVDGEVGLPRRGLERALAREVRQIKSAGHAHATVVVVEARNDALDERAYSVVVFDEPLPINFTPTPERRARELRHQARLAQELRRRRPKRSARRVNHAHRVLDADELLARRLNVALGATEARKDQRLLAGDQMIAVELGADINAKPQSSERVGGVFRVRAGAQ